MNPGSIDETKPERALRILARLKPYTEDNALLLECVLYTEKFVKGKIKETALKSICDKTVAFGRRGDLSLQKSIYYIGLSIEEDFPASVIASAEVDIIYFIARSMITDDQREKFTEEAKIIFRLTGEDLNNRIVENAIYQYEREQVRLLLENNIDTLVKEWKL